MSEEDLDKYEYLTGEGVDYKPSAAEKAKFEYYPLGRVFNRGLKDEDTKEGLVKRIKNIEDKNEELLKSIKSKTDIKWRIHLFDEDLTLEAFCLWIREIKSIEENVDYQKLYFKGSNTKRFRVLTVLRYFKSELRTFVTKIWQ